MGKEKEIDHEDCPVCEESIALDITKCIDGQVIELECPHCEIKLTGEVVKYACLYDVEEDDDED